MDQLDLEIEEWRAFVEQSPAVDGRDVEELEDHLRAQIADLTEVGLSPDEALLVAVKRMGTVDELSREFAREHSGRLWRQLVISDVEAKQERRAVGGWRHSVRRRRGRHDPGRTYGGGVPDRTGIVAGAKCEPLRLAVPGRLLRPAKATHPAPIPGDGRAIPDRRGGDQRVPLHRGRVDRIVGRHSSAGRAVVRGRLPVHERCPDDRTSGGWTSSASPGNGSSITC